MSDRNTPSNPMSAVESVSIRTETRHDGATMYHVVARVDQSFAAAVAVRDHIAQLVTAPVETTECANAAALAEHFAEVVRDFDARIAAGLRSEYTSPICVRRDVVEAMRASVKTSGNVAESHIEKQEPLT